MLRSAVLLRAPALTPRLIQRAPVVFPRQNISASCPTRSLSSTPRLLRGASQWAKQGPIHYEELKPLTERPTDDILLIDVREPPEVVQGNIPSSVNLPMSEFEHAAKMDDADFFRQYAFRKPAKDQKIIVHCKAGKRSESVKNALYERGWKNVRNYTGSWDDWKVKEAQKPSITSDDD